jgi:hypothetical protein
MVWLAVLAAVAIACATPAEARRRAPKRSRQDAPATRADVARAIEPESGAASGGPVQLLADARATRSARPVLDARRTDDGRVITANDVMNIEDVAIDACDEMGSASTRVSRLTSEIEQLRREIRDLRRR